MKLLLPKGRVTLGQCARRQTELCGPTKFSQVAFQGAAGAQALHDLQSDFQASDVQKVSSKHEPGHEMSAEITNAEKIQGCQKRLAFCICHPLLRSQQSKLDNWTERS
jgi:hypothetical protein